MQSLCTLRDHCRQGSRNTRYQAGAAPYLDRSSTGWIAPACLAHSFDHLVGAGDECRRHFEVEHPCGLSVNDELELADLLDRQFPRLRTLEDATGIDADDTPRIRDVGSVAHQPAG